MMCFQVVEAVPMDGAHDPFEYHSIHEGYQVLISDYMPQNITAYTHTR